MGGLAKYGRQLAVPARSTRRATLGKAARQPSAVMRQRLRPWSPGIQTTWSVALIRAVLQEHERGQLWRSSLLVDAMGRDDRLMPILRHRVRGLLGLPLEMVPPDDSEAAGEFAKLWLDMWPRAAPLANLARLLQDYIMLGVAVAQISWEKNAITDEWEPRLHNEHPSFLYWDEASYSYKYQTREEGMVDIVPGDGKWILLEAGERGYRNGAVRALALLWYIRELGWFDHARYNEKHGMPLLMAKHPAEIRDDEREDFWEDIRTLGRETTVLLPQGVGPNGESFDLALLEAQDGSYGTFEVIRQAAGTSMAIYLLGQNLTTEIDAGSFAAATVHKNVKTEILQADEKEVGDDIFQQFVIPTSELLREGGAKLAPRPTLDTTPPEDLKTDAETWRTLMGAVSVALGTGMKVDVKALADKYKLPIETVEQKIGQVLFRYHLDFGILSINEARARLGEDPIPGGDVRPVPSTDPTLMGEIVKRQDSGPKAFIEGQTFTDAIAAQTARAAGEQLEDDMLKDVVDIVESSSDWKEVEKKVLELYGGDDAEERQKILRQAYLVADLNGLHSAIEEA
jgi:phage gp29-like protein